MANIGTGALGRTLIGQGNTTSPTFVDIGTDSGLTQHGLVLSQNLGAFTALAPGVTTGQVLQSGGVAADPAYSTATYPSTATAAGTILRADGTNWEATTATYPNTTTSQQILYSSANNVVGELATANSAIAATNSSGTLAMRAFSVVTQVFTSDGTYTPTDGMLYCIIECIGSGGGGGGSSTTSSSQGSAAGGGGGGGYARKTVSAATIGASQSVTVGNGGAAGAAGAGNGGTGGTVSVGSIVSATGGSGGQGVVAAPTPNGSLGGSGGVGVSGDFNSNGGNGAVGISTGGATTNFSMGGQGGNSVFGGGAPSRILLSGQIAGADGKVYGGGGSGGLCGVSGTQSAGGVGGKGIVIINEYVIA